MDVSDLAAVAEYLRDAPLVQLAHTSRTFVRMIARASTAGTPEEHRSSR